MNFSDIYAYSEEQIRAIDIAKREGNAVFLFEGISYRIEKGFEGFTVLAFSGEKQVGHTSTGKIGKHYALRVDGELQGRGIGKVLFGTKVALDGILDSEWSGRSSRILFLIKRGYVPTGRILNEIILPLEKEELDIITKGIKTFYDTPGVGGDGDHLTFKVHLEYNPEAARVFLDILGI